ncbi:MAG: cytochrome-c peroxidase [Bacteroidetes bacterium]|nr:cytochrome-c peroxidase [Bacteroidota bacterium]
MRSKTIVYIFISMLCLAGCKVDPDLESDEIKVPIVYEHPEGFPQAVYDFVQNPVTTEKFLLGKKLFYDTRLSKDNTISCGECHQQHAGFAHSEHGVSHGINGLLGTRNAPPIFNLAYHAEFMWDGGINNLEVQPIGPITNPVEMDETIENVVAKLKVDATYREMFRSAFGTDEVNSQRMLRALSTFMVMITSAQSKFDLYKKGKETLTAAESDGYTIYKAKCSTCHSEPLMTDLTYRNNGLDSYFDKDPGRAKITFDLGDSGKFKVPSLRNIEVTGPYMHDGRFLTLDKVLTHYGNVKQSYTLDTLLTNGITLTQIEKENLTAFLLTLTDKNFLQNKLFNE